MAAKYDEDVYENPFFMKIMSDYPSLLEKAVTSKGILCVPKYSIARVWTPTQADIEDHLLIPTEESGDDDDDFMTLSKKIVHISDGKIVTKDGFSKPGEVPVMFAETFHAEEGGSYRVFCIGGLLNQEFAKSPTEANPTKTVSPGSYQQILDMLWSHSGGQKTRDSLDKLLNSYAVMYDRLEGETLRSIVDAASTHFTKAMQLLLKDSVVRRSVRHNPEYMDSLKIAVETYVMNAIHKRLFRVITAAMANDDAEINKITRNLVDLQLSDLGIRKIFSQNIPPAKKELSQLNKYSTPMGRLFCIKRVVASLTRPPKQLIKTSSKENVAMMTTDDLLPILIFLIIKSEIPNWMANLVYMQHFHFAKSSDDDEFGFYLASVEAALEHIRNGNIKDEIKPLKRERWNSILVTEPNESSATSSPTHVSRQTSHSSIDTFFRLVQEGEEEKVRQMLERPQKTTEEIHLKLCHPLCSCDKCDKLVSSLRSNSRLVTAYTRDNRGYTALHIASYYGQGLLIDLLIQNNAVVDATDYLGLTPLHLACQRGYQNVMLLLLHFEADIMAVDNEGNTPLHLSCANGHEDCVKAMVFYDASVRNLNINCANEFGDTPLHLAAKWGYESIVKTLLENGADATVCNRKRQTPVFLAQNVKVQRWLQLAAEGLDFQPIRPQFVSPSATSKSRSSSSSSGTPVSSSQRAGSLDMYEPKYSTVYVVTESLEAATESERRKQKEKLFKAIIGGDIQLVKFYLGLETTDLDDAEDDDMQPVMQPASLADMCHPLCQCDKCRGIQRATRRSVESMSVNAKTSTGYCPIHMAVLHNHCDIVALLISLKADISVQNHKGLTALHLACCVRNSLITDMLVKAGARIEVSDMNGDTPLAIAASNGFINGVHILMKAGASLNTTNNRGNTALHEALKRDHNEIATTLLNAGCDPRIANKHGKLPVHETDDPSMQAAVLAAALKMAETEEKSQGNGNSRSEAPEGKMSNPTVPVKNGSQNGQISMKELFTAFEAKDINALNNIAASIRSFDKNASLRKTQTRDKSAPYLGQIARKHSIESFNRGTLRKTKTVDKYDPLYLYRVSRSFSQEDLTHANGSFASDNSFDGQLTPVKSNTFHAFSSFDDSPLTPLPSSESFDHDEMFHSKSQLFKNASIDDNQNFCDPDSSFTSSFAETSKSFSATESTSRTSSPQHTGDRDSLTEEGGQIDVLSPEKPIPCQTTTECESSESLKPQATGIDQSSLQKVEFGDGSSENCSSGNLRLHSADLEQVDEKHLNKSDSVFHDTVEVTDVSPYKNDSSGPVSVDSEMAQVLMVSQENETLIVSPVTDANVLCNPAIEQPSSDAVPSLHGSDIDLARTDGAGLETENESAVPSGITPILHGGLAEPETKGTGLTLHTEADEVQMSGNTMVMPDEGETVESTANDATRAVGDKSFVSE